MEADRNATLRIELRRPRQIHIIQWTCSVRTARQDVIKIIAIQPLAGDCVDGLVSQRNQR